MEFETRLSEMMLPSQRMDCSTWQRVTFAPGRDREWV